jgi:hypothetical protein
MKVLIFLIVLGGAIAFLVWRDRKFQADAERTRREARNRRKRKDSAALGQDTEKIWPVIIRPVSGKQRTEDESAVEQPTMASIEFEPSSTPADGQDVSRKTSG